MSLLPTDHQYPSYAVRVLRIVRTVVEDALFVTVWAFCAIVVVIWYVVSFIKYYFNLINNA